jgi:hypothetical protein
MFLADAGATASTTITSVLTQLTEVFTWLIGKIGDLVGVIMAQPLLLIPIGITLSYVVVRFFKMLFSLVR